MPPIIVCGHIGGGTSIIARLLQTEFGIMMNFGPLKRDHMKPKGYYEEPVLVKMNNANFMRYLSKKGKLVDDMWHRRFEKYIRYMRSHYLKWGFKEPRMNIILREAMQHFKTAPTFIRCTRHIDKVKRTQKKMLPLTDSELSIIYKENEIYLDRFLKPFFHLTLDMTDYREEKILISEIQKFLKAKSIMNPAFVNKLSQHEVFNRWQ